MLDSPCIVLDRVSRRFEDKQALEQVTATIRPGEFVAIIGPSGAGSTIKLINQLLVGVNLAKAQSVKQIGTEGRKAHSVGVGARAPHEIEN